MTCCAKPKLHTEYYKWPLFHGEDTPVQKMNRVCLNCYTHWAGTVGEEQQYSRKEWDAMMMETMTV